MAGYGVDGAFDNGQEQQFVQSYSYNTQPNSQLVYTEMPTVPVQRSVVVQQPVSLPQQTIQYTQPMPQTRGSVAVDNVQEGTAMTSTWMLPKEAPSWVSKASADWRAARTKFLCALIFLFLVCFAASIYVTVLVWQNPNRLAVGTDLMRLTKLQGDLEYGHQVKVHNTRMCAFSMQTLTSGTDAIGAKEFNVAYDAAKQTFDKSYTDYQNIRGDVIKQDTKYVAMGTARDSLVSWEAGQIAKCTGELGMTGTEWLGSADLKAGVEKYFSNTYANFNTIVGAGFGVIDLDLSKIWEWRRADNWWASYQLFICFAVLIVLLGIFIPFFSAANANLTRAGYVWDEGAPRMLPRQCQGAGAMWNELERKKALWYVDMHSWTVFGAFVLFMFFTVMPFCFEWDSQDHLYGEDEMVKYLATLNDARLVDDRITMVTRTCALQGLVTSREEYNVLDAQMPALLNDLQNSQSHLYDRAGYRDTDTWKKNQENIETMVKAYNTNKARRDTVMAVCADPVQREKTDGIGAVNRGIAFAADYKTTANDFMNAYKAIRTTIETGFSSSQDLGYFRIRDVYRGVSITWCILNLFVMIYFVYFMLVLTRNNYESKVPHAFKEVGLSSGI